MSDYYDYGETLIPGSVAKAEEVAAELQGVQAGFDLLPLPRPDGNGFLQNIYIPNATQEGHAATLGQLKVLEESAQDAKTDAEAANANIQNVLFPDITSKHSDISGWHTQVDAWQQSAEDSSDLAQLWANEDEDVEVETGLYSARHWAKKAEQLTSGARVYVGGWDASGGSMPIASPTSLDAGKFWRITVAGTLPVVGAVAIEDELSIRLDLSYELLPSNASVQSVNGQTGTVVITKTTLGLGDVPNYPATDSLSDGSSSKFSTAKAALDLKALADAAQSTADTGVANAATAQSTANTALSTANTALSTANDASPSTHTHTLLSLGAAADTHDHDADYYPATTNAALKSALNAEPTNWVLKWSGSSQTVTNSWGAGTYLVKLVSDLHIKLTITDGATSANAAPASISVAFLYGVTGTTSSFTGHQLSLVGNTNNYWTITDVYRAE